ncbi:hypothetical protein SAMN05216238_109173 [Lentibacillus persicus]|uniref:Uncharacterized protein n=1 Tax=Lentibacillus persicus TaxID=640948 RepID=A0A1I1YGT9_9BACI|nr:hypothetical protein [Lentibacillus persicus]SFE18741.1 hypothetical protein SAMN05216238_109173 [Lentibacillus persicus]
MPNNFDIHIIKDANIFELEIFSHNKPLDFPSVNTGYTSVVEINKKIRDYFSSSSCGELCYNLRINGYRELFFEIKNLMDRVSNFFSC